MHSDIAFLLLRAFGVAGFVLYLIAFVGVQSGRICPRGMAYPAVNVAAASLVLVGLQAEWNLSSALIQLTWITVGLTTVGRRVWKMRDTDAAPLEHV
jgi:phage shock protein PspC (stress-responsive transcriptional regulator)